MSIPRRLTEIGATAIIGLGLSVTIPLIAFSSDKPPAGSKDASCRYNGGIPYFCRVRVDQSENKITLWIPEGRQSAMTFTYSGTCLRAGCVLTGEDWGYLGGAERYRILHISPDEILWIGERDDKRLQEIHFLGD